MLTAGGRVRYMEAGAWERRKKAQREASGIRAEAALDGFKVSIDSSKRHPREEMGSGGDRHINYVEFDAEEADSGASTQGLMSPSAPPAGSVVTG